ncbi:hypothetical protein [Streptomyces sp. McG3]|uniref:hypothetical protein n=1 Tax=Streptomyces sp. McG3 TaxID=2725483 RepID=UPI001BE5A25E|nr:hypothetical protein [Streptomyces sp. McG3]MBT2897993.1 hypothetical protein [Streptomyces sp. McG3]
MDIGEIAQRSIEIVVAQGSAAVSSLVFDTLSAGPESESAAVALRESPENPATQITASRALERILGDNRGLARMLETKLEQLQPSNNEAISFGTGHAGVVSQTGKGNRSHIGNKTTKRGGAFWGFVAAVVVIIGGGSTLLVVQNDSEPTVQEQAQKAALDFIRASYGGDVVTMCGLRSERYDTLPCDTAEEMESAQAEADEDREDIERAGLTKNWEISDSKFPSDNRALITLDHAKIPQSVVVDLTHETGAWRVASLKGAV